jgi:ribosomal protein S18 acetylase RimI-like enzyme
MPSEIESQMNWLFRPAERQDADDIHRLLGSIAAAEGNISTTTREDVVQLFEDIRIDPPDDSRLVFDDQHALVGAAWVVVNPAAEGHAHAELWFDTHPDCEYKGFILEALLAWVEERGSQRIHQIHPAAELPRFLLTACWQDHNDRAVLLDRHGFIPLRYFYRMRRDLQLPVPEPVVPPDLILCTYRSELSEALRQAYNQIFREDWNFQYANPVDWQRLYVGRQDFFPENTFLAMAGDEIAGFSLNHVHGIQADQQEGFITYIGTHENWRKRGVATILLNASLRAFQQRGLPSASLAVDTDNPNEAFTLYRKQGFMPQRILVHYLKQV